MADPTPSGTTPNVSVDSAFAILRLFALAVGTQGVSDIARQVDLPLSTTHRVVSTLCDNEFLEQHQRSGEYEPGLRVRELLAALHARYPVRAAAMPTLRNLASDSKQAAVLQVRFHDQSLRIAGIRDHQLVCRPLLIGQADPLHDTPAGLTILAFQSPQAIQGYLDHSAAAPSLDAALRQVRADGLLMCVEGGLRSVAFPVRNAAGTAVAAIVLEGASVSFDPPEEHDIGQWMRVVQRFEQTGVGQPHLLHDPFAG